MMQFEPTVMLTSHWFRKPSFENQSSTWKCLKTFRYFVTEKKHDAPKAYIIREGYVS